MKKFTISYPVKPIFYNQKFGEVSNLPYYQTNGVNIVGHNGIDFMAKHGQPVYAAHDGIAYPEVDAKQGHGVVLITPETFDYKGEAAYFKTIYWHFIDNIPVAWGQFVKKGEIIGYADSTGLSTGDHLHFGLKPMRGNDPYESSNIEQDNGYLGAIDPMPYFDGTFAYEADTNATFVRDLSLGKSGDDVRELQAILIELGYLTPDCLTGFFWFKTLGAVIQYQKANNISPALGYVGRLTRANLNSKY